MHAVVNRWREIGEIVSDPEDTFSPIWNSSLWQICLDGVPVRSPGPIDNSQKVGAGYASPVHLALNSRNASPSACRNMPSSYVTYRFMRSTRSRKCFSCFISPSGSSQNFSVCQKL